MFAAVSTKSVAQWASHATSALASSAATFSAARPTTVMMLAGTRRHVHRFSSCTASVDHALAAAAAQQRNRIHSNMARLYARRTVELAAASAAAHRFVAQLEDDSSTSSSSAKSKPVNWQDWERKEWSQELRAQLGRNPVTRWWAAVQRVASLTCLVAPFGVLYPLSLVSDRVHNVSWKYAIWGIEQAGPTYIKLFQWATTRQDLFSPEFCQYFGKLQDETIGHAWKDTVRILEQELGLGNSIDEYLKLDKKTPIGSGCIAQVYRGTLLKPVGKFETGTEVAVKVQHPGIWNKVCVDFYIMGLVARWLEALPLLNLQFLSVADSVRQFRDIMLPQLDLTLEARHLQRFNADFASDDHVTFPQPLSELTSTRVLTETFVRGTPILQFVNAPENERYDLASLGLNTTLNMIFLNDFLHGDLHPGNILVSRDKKVGLILHLLDCGLVVEMGPDQHVNLIKILGAFTRRNGNLAGQLMVDTTTYSQASDLDVELFVKGIERIVKEDEDNNFLEKVGDYITDICFLACQRKVKLEASFINAALAVEIMEGIATALYPSLQVTKVALPIVMQAELMHRLPKFSLW